MRLAKHKEVMELESNDVIALSQPPEVSNQSGAKSQLPGYFLRFIL